MRAATFDRFGPPSELYVTERQRPAPAPHQALVRVEAAGVNPLEWRLVRGKPYLLRFRTGLLRPKSPKLTRVPRVALPLILPFCTRRRLTRFGINMVFPLSSVPTSVGIQTE